MREAINLDGLMTHGEVMQAVRHLSGKGSRLYRKYAAYKVCAMDARLHGRTRSAQEFEELCERIYNRLPEDLKW